jgi:toxin FitB
MILLDTNVISEVMKPNPEPRITIWIDSHPLDDLCTSAIVAAEILSGLDLMPAGKRRNELRDKAEIMFSSFFSGRIFAFNLDGARAYGKIVNAARKAGKPMDEMDALIAATALAHEATLATRNTSHFEQCGVNLVNPWL